MSITANLHFEVVGESVADLKTQLANLLGVALGRVAVTDDPAGGEPAVTVQQPQEQETRRRGRRSNAEKEAAVAAQTNGATEPAAAAEAEQPEKPAKQPRTPPDEDDILELLGCKPPATAPVAVTKEAIQALATDLIGKKGVTGLKELLKPHGFSKIGEIPESAYPAIHADMVEALA